MTWVNARHMFKGFAVVTSLSLIGYLLLSALLGSSVTIKLEWATLRGFLPESSKATSPESDGSNLTWLHSLSINKGRLQHLRKTCSLHGDDHYLVDNNRREEMNTFLVDQRHQLMYCFIPKVASSTMKRVFSILEGKNRGQSLFNLSSRFIHRIRGSYTQMRPGTGSFLRRYHAVNKFTKFLIVRDPYERLFSAFVDRLFGISENLVKMTRLVKMPQSERQNRCAVMNLRFSHLVDYVTRFPPTGMDQHYTPYFVSCFPCHISYDYISKMETFRSDVENVLTSVGVDSREVLGDEEKFNTTSELSILRDVSKRAFEIMKKNTSLNCFTKYQFLKRNWVTFQIRGYLSINDSFPWRKEAEVKNVTCEQFLQKVQAAYLGVTDRQAVQLQKDLAMREAYYSVPHHLLHKLQAVLQRDCDLFGYDCSVDRRFNESQRPKPVFHFNRQ
ncbi:carbohydrate sulfotransferase 13-like [Babylonia areolata]|uniref:carbohydrate sulfotransferase 13-like n=1 Tax=Babylonia areolata TaxID=304850 RepID=UPI003FD1BB41